MAHVPRYGTRLTVVAAVMAAIFVSAAAQGAGDVRVRPKRHFLSWESVNAHDAMKPWQAIKRPEREFEVKKLKTVRFKKPGFINRKPVQFATPVFADGRIFVGTTAGWFYAIDAENNHKSWSFETEGPIEAPAAVRDGSVYVGDLKGYAYSFDAVSGRLNWKVPLFNEIMGAPLVESGCVYLVTMDGRLFALSVSTGVELWHTDAMERQVGFSVREQSSPAFCGGLIVYGTSRGTLVAFDTGGNLAWVRMLGDPQSQVADVDSRPLIVGDALYAASSSGEVFRINPRDGTIIWSVAGGGANDLLWHDGWIFATDGGILTAVDPVSGSVVWEQNFETAGISAPAGGQGFVAVVSTKDKLYLVDQLSGDIVYERFISHGTYGDPLVVGDRLYVLSNTSRLFSFAIHEKAKREKKQKKQRVKASEIPTSDAGGNAAP